MDQVTEPDRAQLTRFRVDGFAAHADREERLRGNVANSSKAMRGLLAFRRHRIVRADLAIGIGIGIGPAGPELTRPGDRYFVQWPWQLD